MLGRQTITYYRKSGGAWNEDGEWESDTEESGTILASVQPLNQDERAQYIKPDTGGEAIVNAIKLYSNSELQTSKQGTSQEADEIEYRGRRYKIVDVLPFQSGIISHFKMIAWEVANGTDTAESVSESDS